MTHNKPSKEEGLFPLPFLFLFYIKPPTICYACATAWGGKRQKLHKNNRRKEAMPDESNKESQKKAGESKARRF